VPIGRKTHSWPCQSSIGAISEASALRGCQSATALLQEPVEQALWAKGCHRKDRKFLRRLLPFDILFIFVRLRGRESARHLPLQVLEVVSFMSLCLRPAGSRSLFRTPTRPSWLAFRWIPLAFRVGEVHGTRYYTSISQVGPRYPGPPCRSLPKTRILKGAGFPRLC
jgi:hypothetical protein